MNVEKLIRYHPTRTHADDLKAICQPLKDYLNISYFCHVHLDKKNHLSGLGLHPNFAEHYFRQKYFNVDSHLTSIQSSEEYIIQDHVNHTGLTEALFKDCYDFGLHHLFTIVQKNDHATHAFHFATSTYDANMNGRYLTYLPFLKNFILFFKEKVLANKQLAAAYHYQIPIDVKLGGYQIVTPNQKEITTNLSLHSLQLKKYHLPAMPFNDYLTKREMECVFWLHKGKTAEEIAIILNISERTIRAHINHIKKKFACSSLFQLGEKIAKSNFIEVFEYEYLNKR